MAEHIERGGSSRTTNENLDFGILEDPETGSNQLPNRPGTGFDTIGDLGERRRSQNRIVQRNHRANTKKRLEGLIGRPDEGTDAAHELCYMRNSMALNELDDPLLVSTPQKVPDQDQRLEPVSSTFEYPTSTFSIIDGSIQETAPELSEDFEETGDKSLHPWNPRYLAQPPSTGIPIRPKIYSNSPRDVTKYDTTKSLDEVQGLENQTSHFWNPEQLNRTSTDGSLAQADSLNFLGALEPWRWPCKNCNRVFWTSNDIFRHEQKSHCEAFEPGNAKEHRKVSPMMEPHSRPALEFDTKEDPTVTLDQIPLDCTICRTKNIKCDRVQPICSACYRAHSQCRYLEFIGSVPILRVEEEKKDNISRTQSPLSCTSCEENKRICDQVQPICSSCLRSGSLKLCRYRSADRHRIRLLTPKISEQKPPGLHTSSSHPPVMELEPGVLMIDGQIAVFEPVREHETIEISTKLSSPSLKTFSRGKLSSFIEEVALLGEKELKRDQSTRAATWAKNQHELVVHNTSGIEIEALAENAEPGLATETMQRPQKESDDGGISEIEDYGDTQDDEYEVLSEYESTVEAEDHDISTVALDSLTDTSAYESSRQSRVSIQTLKGVTRLIPTQWVDEKGLSTWEMQTRNGQSGEPPTTLKDNGYDSNRTLSPYNIEGDSTISDTASDSSKVKYGTAVQSRYVRTPDDVESPYDQMRRLSIKAAELVTQSGQRRTPSDNRAASSTSLIHNPLSNQELVRLYGKAIEAKIPKLILVSEGAVLPGLAVYDEGISEESKSRTDHFEHNIVDTQYIEGSKDSSNADPLKQQDGDLTLKTTEISLESLAVEPLLHLQRLEKEASDKENHIDMASPHLEFDVNEDEIVSHNAELGPAHLFPNSAGSDWKDLQIQLPESWMWDLDYHGTTPGTDAHLPGCWTCTPLNDDDPKAFPLTIAGATVVLPVEYTWPPLAGVNPPPDPRPSAPINCTDEVPIEVIRDIFLTFEGSLGFYFLVNGIMQIIVDVEFDKEWASSHLPHKYGGMKVCYIAQSMEPTMLPSTATMPSKTNAMKSRSSLASTAQISNAGLSYSSSFFRSGSKGSTGSLPPALQLNDFIEARTKSSHRKEKFAGRIGAKVVKAGESYLVISSHIVTEAILAKPHRAALFGRNKDRFEKLDGDWNEYVEIWAGNEKIGTIDKSFDPDAEIYPNGFQHDTMLVKPSNPAAVNDIRSPIPNIGWLSRESWNSLRQQNSSLKILGNTESHRAAKTLKTNRPSEVLVVGEGIFLSQTSSKPTKDHDVSTWKDLVSRALLYRVYPDFDPPTGYSGIALYADGLREDGTIGPGVVGFQSFVQRSGHVQNFEMEGGALEKRLKLGRVAFYGAFQVPDALRQEYNVV